MRPRAISPEVTESVKSITPERYDDELRRVVNMMCNIKFCENGSELFVSVIYYYLCICLFVLIFFLIDF